MTNPLKDTFQSFFTQKPSRFFNSPSASGRQITCSFSYLQRLGRGATVDVWFPSKTHESIAKRIAEQDATVFEELGVEWAAIREFSLIQESDYEEDFDAEKLKKAVKDLTKWRGQDGYRITVIMLGKYIEPLQYDELRIHDERLQQEITGLIHMLYKEKESEQYSEKCREALKDEKWNCSQVLPHVVMNLGSMGMTGRGPTHSKKCAAIVKNILNIVERLPKSHIVHDVAVGITIPDHDSKHRREKLLESWEKFTSFQRLISTVLHPLDHISVGMLQGGDVAVETPRHRTCMMRGFGDLRAANEENFVAAQMMEQRLAL